MTRDAFRRLALMVACSVWLAAIAAAWLYIDWIVAAAAILGGTVVAAALTVEPSPPSRDEVRAQVAASTSLGRSIRDIERSARAARSDDVA